MDTEYTLEYGMLGLGFVLNGVWLPVFAQSLRIHYFSFFIPTCLRRSDFIIVVTLSLSLSALHV